MDRENPIYTWPQANSQSLLLAVAAVVLLFVLAVLLDWWRRRRARQALIDAEWRTARQIARERELNPEEWEALQQLLQLHAYETPHLAVSSRQRFDQLVDDALADTARKGDKEALEQQGVLLRDIRTRLGLMHVPMGQRIHTTRDLNRDQVLWAGSNKETAEWYRFRLTGVDEVHFHAAPQAAAAPPFAVDDKITFRMWREEDARYEFVARLERREEQPIVYVFRHSRELKRMQSREYYRLAMNQPTNIGLVDAQRGFDPLSARQLPITTRLRGRITSLSGGGMAVLVQQPPPHNVLVRAEIMLGPEAGAVNVTGRLVDVASLHGGQYLLRAAFVALTEDEQERITHHIFKRQQQHAAEIPADPLAE